MAMRDSSSCSKLVLTNFEQDEESRMAMEARANAYLIKAEITPNKLLSVIEQLG